MDILTSLEIQNYRSIRGSKLNKLKGLNILIGPNNCGKTNILKAIDKLTKMELDSSTQFPSTDPCQTIKATWDAGHNYIAACNFSLVGIKVAANKEDSYKNFNNFQIAYEFSPDYLETCFRNSHSEASQTTFKGNIFNLLSKANPSSLNQLNRHLQEIGFGTSSSPETTPNILTIKQSESGTVAQHISLFSIPKLAEYLSKRVKYIEDNRLTAYKEQSFVNYLRSQNLSGNNIQLLIKLIPALVDSKIGDYHQNSLDFIKYLGNSKHIDSIQNQGSGVRSLLCLAIDVLSMGDGSILLIDEPELGLNPFGKQELLKFLKEQSRNKQIFITTQDPTFVNPILFDDAEVSVYHYSLRDEAFKKVDMAHKSGAEYSTFGGYLPHTTSLKDIHLYVEGHTEVQVFQILLRKYITEMHDTKLFEHLSRVEIFSLGGSCWEDYLYTIPKPPYKSVVILDGDKFDSVKQACRKYKKLKLNTAEFEFYGDIYSLIAQSPNSQNLLLDLVENSTEGRDLEEDDSDVIKDSPVPVICLKEKCIEKYIDPDYDCDHPPENYDKVAHGIENALRLTEIPDEFKAIFNWIINEIKSSKY